MGITAKRRRATTETKPGYARNSRGRRSTSSEAEEQQAPSPKRRRTAIEVVEDLEDREIQQTLGKSPFTTPVSFGSYRRLRQSTLVQRYETGRCTDSYTPSYSSNDEPELTETDSDAEEDARIERSMGVIRKKTATRGTEGGTKYHCDVCSVDVTSTVSCFPDNHQRLNGNSR